MPPQSCHANAAPPASPASTKVRRVGQVFAVKSFSRAILFSIAILHEFCTHLGANHEHSGVGPRRLDGGRLAGLPIEILRRVIRPCVPNQTAPQNDATSLLSRAARPWSAAALPPPVLRLAAFFIQIIAVDTLKLRAPEDRAASKFSRPALLRKTGRELALPHSTLVFTRYRGNTGKATCDGYLLSMWMRIVALRDSAESISNCPVCRLREKFGKKVAEICTRMR